MGEEIKKREYDVYYHVKIVETQIHTQELRLET